MRRILGRLMVVVGVVLTSTWPLLLCGALAGGRGLQVGLLAYLFAAGLLLFVLLLGGIRGILDY